MSDNSELPGYPDFTPEVFHHLANQNRGHIHVVLESQFSRGLFSRGRFFLLLLDQISSYMISGSML